MSSKRGEEKMVGTSGLDEVESGVPTQRKARWVGQPRFMECGLEVSSLLRKERDVRARQSGELASVVEREIPPRAGENARVRDDAESGMTESAEEYEVMIPWLMAEADANANAGEWWERMRRDPKRSGEISQLAFLLKAKQMGFKVALPWGDSERWDCVVWAHEGGPMLRVQVKGTGRLYRRGYEVQPVHSTRGQGKKRYTKREIDVLVGHVQPVDAWYLIPIEEVGRAKSLRFYPGIECAAARWEQWRDRWEVLGS